jgi:flagellar motility protein MotE (MotC chaperone)
MMTYYQKNRARILDLARKYREANRAEINRKQRERYATNEAYRQYQADYREEYRRLYGRIGNHEPDSNS